MQESRTSRVQQVPVDATLNVQTVERELNELWMQNAGAADSNEEGVAMLRARVLNLMVYVTSEDALNEVDEMLMDVAGVHPCRALVMIADADGSDKDIEMNVASRCQLALGAGGQHLCCEEVTLRASGRFAAELPSACLPLLVQDLPVFLWLRASTNFSDSTFQSLVRSADRVVIDSLLAQKPHEDLRALADYMIQHRKDRQGVSDTNWARLTPWRMLLASFYDSPENADALAQASHLRIDYVPQAAEMIPTRALLLAGWLASRLGWQNSDKHNKATSDDNVHHFFVEKDGRPINIEFRSSVHKAVAPGGITRVELIVEGHTSRSFIGMREEDSRDLQTQEASNADTQRTGVLSGLDRAEVDLLISELEILSHDRVYEEAVTRAVNILDGQ